GGGRAAAPGGGASRLRAVVPLGGAYPIGSSQPVSAQCEHRTEPRRATRSHEAALSGRSEGSGPSGDHPWEWWHPASEAAWRRDGWVSHERASLRLRHAGIDARTPTGG